MRDLEARLGLSLFSREAKKLALTEAGRLYLPFATDAIARLRAGDRAVLDPQRRARVLTVSVSPSFAAKWLVPRLGELSVAHPDLDLRISANPQHIDFSEARLMSRSGTETATGPTSPAPSSAMRCYFLSAARHSRKLRDLPLRKISEAPC